MSTQNELALTARTGEQIPRSYQPEKELTIKDLLHLLRRRRAVIASTMLFCFVAAVLVCIFSTRRYLATAELQVQKESSSGLGIQNPGEEQTYSDALEDNIALQTQAGILQSDTLALQVIKELDLEHTQDFQPVFNPIGWVMSKISPDGPPDPKQASLEDSPRRRMNVLNVFAKNLRVKPVAGTRLIDVSYLNPDPRIAAEVVNHLSRGLADYNFQTKHDATSQTAQWLAGELSDLRKQSEALQAKVALAQRESGVVTLGGVDAMGREQLYSTVLDKLQQATAAYTKAESDRIEKGAIYQVAKSGDAEAISGLSSNPMFAGSSNMDSALSLIQGLRMEKATLKGQLAEAEAKFGSAYPKLTEMQKHADSIDEAIHTEVQRVAERSKNDYDVARQVEENTRNVYADQKHQADALNDKTIGYTILRQEADESRTLYESLFKQLKQAGILAGFRSNNISIVDPARVPAKPAKPRVLIYLAASLCAGLFMGCFGAFLRDGLDNKIHDLPALEAQLGQMPIGILPFHKETRYIKSTAKPTREPKRERSGTILVLTDPKVLPPSPQVIDAKLPSINPGAGQFPALTDPRSQYTEAVRALRTSLLLSGQGAPPKVVLITSSVAGEGKSMLSLNLAALFAQQGKKALLIDADLRRPSLHRKLNVDAKEGLSSLLADHRGEAETLAAPIETSDVPGLWLLPAGPPPPFPAELLGSPQMRQNIQLWRKHFDFIVIDGCPVLPVTDSVVLSTIADFTVLVARYKLTNRNSLERSYQLLNSQSSGRNTGIVLNAVTRTASSYYQYYGYKNSGYYTKDEVAHANA